MLFQLTPAAMPEGYGDALLPLAACRAWLGIVDEVTEFDPLIEALRDAAIDMVEKYTSLYLGPRTGLVATFTGFGPAMRVGRGPNLAVTALSYVDSDGATVALAEGDWRVEAGGRLIPAIGACWPVAYGSATVTFDAGFAAGTCPPALLSAAKMFMAHLFAHREAVVATGTMGELPLGFRTLCELHRMPVV